MTPQQGMETDWNVEAAGNDPLIEVPWQDETSGLRYCDLRVSADEQAARIASLPEAVASSALAGALRLLNAPDGLLMTSKCDRWALDDEERAELADAIDAETAASGWGSYMDVLMVHAVPRADFLLHEEWARATAMRCAALDQPAARLDVVVRPSQVHGEWGYGLSLYVYAAGDSALAAERAWAAVLEACVPVLCAAAEATMMPPEQGAK